MSEHQHDNTTDEAPRGGHTAVTASHSKNSPADTEPADAHDAAQHAGDDQADALGKVRREAANYRTKLRDTEGERDALAERLRTLQRGEVERLAATQADHFRPLNDGGDLWRAEGVELDGLLDDDGNVDMAKVRDVATTVAADHPHWLARPFPVGDADQGKGAAPAVAPSNPFAAGLKGAAGH